MRKPAYKPAYASTLVSSRRASFRVVPSGAGMRAGCTTPCIAGPVHFVLIGVDHWGEEDAIVI